ncbi:SapB/AmfS family lanthipeptide [Streptomyces sp. NPDC050315]
MCLVALLDLQMMAGPEREGGGGQESNLSLLAGCEPSTVSLLLC